MTFAPPDKLRSVFAFSGTRYGLTRVQREALRLGLMELEPDVVAHGGCAGADTEFDALVWELFGVGCTRCVFPGVDGDGESSWRGWWRPGVGMVEFSEDEYLVRDHRIVEHGVTGLIACPKSASRVGSGTWKSVDYALALGRHVWLVWPDGRVEIL